MSSIRFSRERGATTQERRATTQETAQEGHATTQERALDLLRTEPTISGRLIAERIGPVAGGWPRPSRRPHQGRALGGARMSAGGGSTGAVGNHSGQHQPLTLGSGTGSRPSRAASIHRRIASVTSLSSRLLRAPVSHAARKFRHFGDERVVFVAPVQDDLVLVHHARPDGISNRFRRGCRT